MVGSPWQVFLPKQAPWERLHSCTLYGTPNIFEKLAKICNKKAVDCFIQGCKPTIRVELEQANGEAADQN